jgi:hypothetical protein
MTDVMASARGFAVQALLARLPRAAPEKREPLRMRIAAIKAGRLDTAPEVQSASFALKASLTPDQVRGDEQGVEHGERH